MIAMNPLDRPAMVIEKCDKCGRLCYSDNDARMIEVEASIAKYGEKMAAKLLIYCSTSRHFLPVVEGGLVVCQGSPSRAQYVEGQPRDTRGYPYLPEYEEFWRKGLEIVRQKYGG